MQVKDFKDIIDDIDAILVRMLEDKLQELECFRNSAQSAPNIDCEKIAAHYKAQRVAIQESREHVVSYYRKKMDTYYKENPLISSKDML